MGVHVGFIAPRFCWCRLFSVGWSILFDMGGWMEGRKKEEGLTWNSTCPLQLLLLWRHDGEMRSVTRFKYLRKNVRPCRFVHLWVCHIICMFVQACACELHRLCYAPTRKTTNVSFCWNKGNSLWHACISISGVIVVIKQYRLYKTICAKATLKRFMSEIVKYNSVNSLLHFHNCPLESCRYRGFKISSPAIKSTWQFGEHTRHNLQITFKCEFFFFTFLGTYLGTFCCLSSDFYTCVILLADFSF